MQTIQMTTAQQVPWGATIMDAGRPPRPMASLPEGATITFESSNPDIASVEVLPDGMNVIVHSDDVGTATVTATPGGTIAQLPGDTLSVVIVNAAPGSLNMTLGNPTDEA